MATKRRNFSYWDRELLKSLIHKYRDVLENKQSTALAIQAKQHVWHKITSEFNRSADSGPRTFKQLKILHHNFKREVRKPDVKAPESRSLQDEVLRELAIAKPAPPDIIERDTTASGPSTIWLAPRERLILPKLQGPPLLEPDPLDVMPPDTSKKRKSSEQLTAKGYRKLYFKTKYETALRQARKEDEILNYKMESMLIKRKQEAELYELQKKLLLNQLKLE